MVTLAAWGAINTARAAQTDPAMAPDPAPPAPDVPREAPPAAAGTPAPAEAAPPVMIPIAPVAPPEPPRKVPQEKRKKDLETTVGMDPVQHDIGPEADVLGMVDRGVPKLKTKGWKYAMHGFFRAPLRLGIGPRNDMVPGTQWHSPARVPGYNSTEWNYVGLTPNPGGSLYLNISNPNVSGNVIITTDTLNDASYDNLVKIGGVAQAYVTMKFPDLFGTVGGLAWTIGAFSNRYGNAGPRQESTGYYGTYLFGRTHVAGEALTANVDLTDHVELVVEHGFGAKLEVVPYVRFDHTPLPPIAPYLPNQGPVPQGSTYVHHAHVSLLVDDWLMFGAHYLRSFSPNDYANADGFTPANQRSTWASMTVTGGELHIDTPKFGSGYIGYSHVDASNVLPLAGGVEVIHGLDGLGLKQNYFGAINPTLGYYELNPTAPRDDTGKIDTALFQYIVRLAPLLGHGRTGPDVALGVFAMYNHVQAPNSAGPLKQDRLKFGADLDVTPVRFAAIGFRFDRVLPDGPTTDFAYTAISPRLIFHTNWLSREYVIIDYTRYIYGPSTVASAPYNVAVGGRIPRPDPNLVVVSSAISF